MHRTTTTAALLVTVAVSALTGCVTVRHPAAPGPPPGTVSSQPATRRPDGSAVPRVAQAPPREALEPAGPSRPPGGSGTQAPLRTGSTPPAGHRPPLPPGAPHPGRPWRLPAELSGRPLPSRLPTGGEMCALGKRYGGWHKDSPQALVCERAYGH
ncbi:hypothetical protein ACFVY4_17610 [Streptomyces sp. NPDC058299]|uniref:hypothetical protein n=1 Tax=Streptomyces sp. NPDC058299 TaxID=3346435 RepID=UPI0036E4DC74